MIWQPPIDLPEVVRLPVTSTVSISFGCAPWANVIPGQPVSPWTWHENLRPGGSTDPARLTQNCLLTRTAHWSARTCHQLGQSQRAIHEWQRSSLRVMPRKRTTSAGTSGWRKRMAMECSPGCKPIKSDQASDLLTAGHDAPSVHDAAPCTACPYWDGSATVERFFEGNTGQTGSSSSSDTCMWFPCRPASFFDCCTIERELDCDACRPSQCNSCCGERMLLGLTASGLRIFRFTAVQVPGKRADTRYFWEQRPK